LGFENMAFFIYSVLFDVFRLICPSFKIYIIQKWKSQGFIFSYTYPNPDVFLKNYRDYGSFIAVFMT